MTAAGGGGSRKGRIPDTDIAEALTRLDAAATHLEKAA